MKKELLSDNILRSIRVKGYNFQPAAELKKNIYNTYMKHNAH